MINKKEKNEIKEGFFDEKDFISPSYINLNNPRFLEIDDYFYSGITIVNYYREYNDLILKSLIETSINMNISVFYEKKETSKVTASKQVESNESYSSKDILTEASVSSKSTRKTTATSKKASSSKRTTKTSSTKTTKKTTTSRSTTRKKKLSADEITSTTNLTQKIEVIEYYDLPYRYNQTVVRVLAQTPTTLFIYLDISDIDRVNFVKHYGEDFFNNTKPVLVIHNNTMHYSFEIEIDDFANSWYLHINDSKCDYRVELGRRPNYYNEGVTKEIKENIPTDYIYVSISNEIESPNDHVLFNTNENNTIRIRNVKNYNEKSISLYEIIKHLPAMKKVQNIPYISEDLLKGIYSEIYHTKDISVFDKVKNNPSSGGNPSSGSMSSRFI